MVELPSGSVKFQGELEQYELDYVLTLGLTMLLLKGAMPYIVQDGDEAAINPQSTSIQ